MDKKNKKNRKRIFLYIQAAFCVLAVLIPAVSALGIYAEGAARRAEDPLAAIYTAEAVGQALFKALPFFLAGLAMTAAGLFLGIRDENAGKPAGDVETDCDPARLREMLPSGRRLFGARLALLVIALSCIAAGALNGSMADVLAKAVRICTECIGLG